MGRKDDLERNVRECYGVISDYEAVQRDTDRPEERRRARRLIDEQWELIKDYLDEYLPLCRRLGTDLADDLKQLAFSLTETGELPPTPGECQERVPIVPAGMPPARAAGKLGLELIRIPAGWFLMGSHQDDPEAYDWEKPQHRMRLSEFGISRSPVTNAQYREAVEAQICEAPRDSEYYEDPDYADHPVVGVNWYQAMALARWVGGRLPTEAEWEKAARGTGGGKYPWGNEWDESKCNSVGSGTLTTSRVGQYSPRGDSPYGCADMAGNVWEWTLSVWGRDQWNPDFVYPYEAQDGREDLSAPSTFLRVVRGGAFHVQPTFARCAFRYWNPPNAYRMYLGFRVVVPGDARIIGNV